MKNNNTIVFAGCKDTTLECMSSLIEAGYKIDLLITITSELAQKNMVAGFMDLRSYATANNIPVYVADSYSLKSEKDRVMLTGIEIRLLLVIGWQRLIPEWLLDQIRHRCFWHAWIFACFTVWTWPEPNELEFNSK